MAVVWPSKNNFANGDVLTATNMNNIGDTLNVFNPTSATNGQVWIANGAGSGSFQTPTSAAYTQLDSGTMTSGTSKSTATFSAVGYKWLYVQVWGVTASSSIDMSVVATPSSGTNGYFRYNEGTASTAGSGGVGVFELGGFTWLGTGGVNYLECYWYLPTATTGYQYCWGQYWGNSSGPTMNTGVRWMAHDRTAAITGFNINTQTGATYTAGNYRVYGVN